MPYLYVQASIKNAQFWCWETYTVQWIKFSGRLRTSVSQPGLKRTKKIFSGIQQHLLVCIQKCRPCRKQNHQYQLVGNYTTHVHVIMSMVCWKALTLVKQPFIPVRQ